MPSNVGPRQRQNPANVAKANAAKYATQPNPATGTPATRAYGLPSTREQSADPPQTSVSPVRACTVRYVASASPAIAIMAVGLKRMIVNRRSFVSLLGFIDSTRSAGKLRRKK